MYKIRKYYKRKFGNPINNLLGKIVANLMQHFREKL